jgi:hypothetical protein
MGAFSLRPSYGGHGQNSGQTVVCIAPNFTAGVACGEHQKHAAHTDFPVAMQICHDSLLRPPYLHQIFVANPQFSISLSCQKTRIAPLDSLVPCEIKSLLCTSKRLREVCNGTAQRDAAQDNDLQWAYCEGPFITRSLASRPRDSGQGPRHYGLLADSNRLLTV